MGLLKIVLAFVLLAPICQTHQTDQTDAMTQMKLTTAPTITRTHRQVPSYLLDLYNQQTTDDGTVIRAFFSVTGDDCYRSSCYTFHGQAKPWTESREECKKEGGDLVSIETDDEWTFLKDKIQRLNNHYRNEWFIGLRKEGVKWKWMSGAGLTIDRWQSGEPSGDGNYVVMAKNYPAGTRGLFNDLTNRVISRGYICEKRNDAVDECHGDSCYSFYGEGKSWTKNRQECKKQGGDLVSIETDDEWTFLKNKIQGLSNPFHDEWHIGLMKEGTTWKWVNGDPLTLSNPWRKNEPSGDGDYVLMYKNFPAGTQGLFNDISGEESKGYICETTKDRKKTEDLFTFTMTAMQPSEKIRKASLRIFKRPSTLTDQQGNFDITVSRLAIPWKRDDQQWKRELVNVVTKSVAWREDGEWIDLDVTSAAKYWNKYKSKNYGLWVSVRGQGVPSSDFTVATGGRRDPFLVAFCIDENKLPKTSEAEDDDERNEAEGADEDVESPHSLLVKTKATRAGSTRTASTSCRLHHDFMDVADLEWDDWIIAPRQFNADYCKGTCSFPLTAHLVTNDHVSVQTLLASLNKGVPEPCCAPTQLTGMSVLLFNDNGGVELKNWKLVATRCGCR